MWQEELDGSGVETTEEERLAALSEIGFTK
jgi:hypothetical protein